ncbi:glycoside hydrolase family 127 protein [candidate division KSB1 bacterium]|nr:glycoside hydrolase family 127 protein [candidate division KSB1 bacterium]
MNPMTWPRPLTLMDQQAGGELAVRLQRNFDRLEEEKYQPHKVFLTNEESFYWPGDTEGRTVLALALLAQATQRQPRFLAPILQLFPQKMNRLGYFGDIQDRGGWDEQQLASHGWVLRALCELYRWKGDPALLEMIRRILDHLVLPLRGRVQTSYPLDPRAREQGGGIIGTRRLQRVDGWILSTDVGCVFILLDGLVQAWSLLQDDKLRPLIEEMIEVFLRFDLDAIRAQTHATLSALRGLMRYAEATSDRSLVDAVAVRFDLYKRLAMSENYENHGWFGRPSHSEPCAIIDALMTAVTLWRATGTALYLEDAHHITYNALAATQRPNGGFGCNSCCGADSPFLEIRMQEAHWCCTMRGGEGLSFVAQSAYFTRENTVFVPFFADNRAVLRLDGGEVTVEQKSSYPVGGSCTITVVDCSNPFGLEWRLFAPSFLQPASLTLNDESLPVKRGDGFVLLDHRVSAGDTLVYRFDPVLRRLPALGERCLPGYGTVRRGPLILAVDRPQQGEIALPDAELIQNNENTCRCGSIELTPLYHLLQPWRDRQVLFARPKLL